LEEKTAVFFRIALSSEGIWTSQFCHDPIRYDKSQEYIDSLLLLSKKSVKIFAAKNTVQPIQATGQY
jgi:hypothetical protein